jgi:hypothetical protein
MSQAAASQRKSWIARLPRIGGMATLPGRVESMRLAVGDILGQLERLFLYLDGHTQVPDFVCHPKIEIIRPDAGGRWWSSGKFLGANRAGLDCIYFTFDDDLRYPPGYVATLADAVVRYDGEAVVGMHGSLFEPPFEYFLRDRRAIPFSAGLDRDTEVDTIGSGTSAFLRARLPIDPRTWPHLDIDDFMFALDAERYAMPRIAIARPPNYLGGVFNQPDSLAVQAKKDYDRQRLYMNRLLDLERRSLRGMPPRLRRDAAQDSTAVAGATAPLRPSPPAWRSP